MTKDEERAEFCQRLLDRIIKNVLQGDVVLESMNLNVELEAQVFVDDKDGSRAIIIAVTPV